VAAGEDTDNLLTAADLYYRLERYDEAFDLALRVREQVGFNPRSQRVLGLVYLRRGDYVKAVHHLDRADADAATVEGLIRCRLGLGELNRAERLLEAVELVKKPTPELTAAAARTKALLARREELVRQAAPPEDKKETWAAALGRVACAEEAYRQGEPRRRVEEMLAQALKEVPDLGPALALRARLALERGRLRDALADAEKAITAGPQCPGGYYVRGR